jgi:sugar O-acyltransferase (sialic acid O-acetyltransferase NeuD family)
MVGQKEAILVIGARGHAKEILELLHRQNRLQDLAFFDDISTDQPELFYNQYPIYCSINEVKERFINKPHFVLGVGNPLTRYQLSQKLINIGGILASIIADDAFIGHYEVLLQTGLNVMSRVMISNSVSVGEGTLLNSGCALHHDVQVGRYCDIAPGAMLLGGCSVGDWCSIGAQATILPKVKIGDNVVIGAGTVITKNVDDNCVMVGVPGIRIKNLDPLIL